MKRLRLVGVLLGLVLGGQVWAATYYVDATCPTAGNGSSASCLSSPTTNNPKKLLADGIGLLSAQDDVLNIRGVHSTHDNCPGNTEGRYFGDRFSITGKNGASSHPIIIQNNGFTGTRGSGEPVYIDGTEDLGAWTQCSGTAGSCNAPCNGLPSSIACNVVWYVAGSSFSDLAIGAQRPDGQMTRREIGLAGITAQWESYSAQTTGTNIFVYWGTGADAPGGASNSRPYVFTNNNGVGFELGTSSWITIRGVTFRCHRRAAIQLLSSATNIVIDGATILYNADKFNSGSDYGVGWVVLNGGQATPVTIKNSEIAYTGSEGIHTTAGPTGTPLVVTITDNWIHDLGDPTVMGPGSSGTSSGMILAYEVNGGVLHGDSTGSVVSGNLIERTNNPGAHPGQGIVIEKSWGWIVRNNVFRDVNAGCIKYDHTLDSGLGSLGDNIQIYNNLCDNPGDSGLIVETAASSLCKVRDNKIYNNTFYVPDGIKAIEQRFGAGSVVTGNIFRNNILYSDGSQQLVAWTSSGVFQNNIVKSATSGTLIAFNGANKTCAQTITSADVDNDGTGNDNNKCAAPGFVNISTGDFHLKAVSNARNAGTATGMPSGRTADICNGVDLFYNDCEAQQGSAWDIGCDERQ
jgi:hypothetical protein